MTAKNSIIPVFVPHLGCKNRCVFCNQNSISGKLKAPDENDVRHIIKEGLKKLGDGAFPEVAFYGGSFTAISEITQNGLLNAAFEFIKEGKVKSIRLSTRPDAITDEILTRLKNYGVKTIELGAQSMDDKVLEISKRGHKACHVVNASNLIKNRGLKLILQLMAGLPGDSASASLESSEKAAALKPDGVRIYPVAVLCGTELFEMYNNGLYFPPSLESAVNTTAGMVMVFDREDIPVIRIGLNPSADLSGGEVITGAYHPALGDMVRSEVFLRHIIKSVEENKNADEYVFGLNASSIPWFYGYKRQNSNYLKKTFPDKRFSYKTINIKREKIVLITAY